MSFSSSNKKHQKSLTPKEAKLKAAHYCAYQERSQKEVRNKLYNYGLYKDEIEEIISELILEGYINEERFARAYVGGKFRIKKWGRIKIMQGLKQHDISNYCVNKGFEEIDDEEYLNTLQNLIEKKTSELDTSEDHLFKRKLASYLTQKGFEPQLIWEMLNI
ncbi:MAG: regulatory protein RecX [Bacteroidota bacterium]